MRETRTPRAINAPITAPAIAPAFEDLFCGIVVDPWVAPLNPEEPEADEEISEFPDDTIEEDVNVAVALGEGNAEDDAEPVGAGPAVILN
jgi:hypothetical protein